MSGIGEQIFNDVLLALGFGFVIFWHELGHFLAAKWAGVRVEQFAVGFGHAMFSWRKGLGLRWGSSAKEYEQLIQAEKEGVPAANIASISSTEYRLNWIPLGGYVKMLGQDDLNPNAVVDDPRAYNRKTISKRMVIVSAGVIMNVILAAIGFFILFLVGFDVPPPVVGTVLPGSPAQQAGIAVGDRVISFDGKPQRDFNKIQFNVALAREEEAVPVVLEHPDKSQQTIWVTPGRVDPERDVTGFLQMGIGPSPQLEGPPARAMQEIAQMQVSAPDETALAAGEKIVAIQGQPVKVNEYYKLDRAIQKSRGKPVMVTASSDGGKTTREFGVLPHLSYPFTGRTNFGGLVPRAAVASISATSDAKGKLQPGDAVVSVTVSTDTKLHPTPDVLREMLRAAGSNNEKVNLTVERAGQIVTVNDLSTMKIGKGIQGLGVNLDFDAESAVIGSVLPDSPASAAGVSLNDSSDVTVTAIGDEPVTNFHDIKRILSSAVPGPLSVTLRSDAGEKTVKLALSEANIIWAKSQSYSIDLALHDLSEPRHTGSFITAANWGIEETRDSIGQFYVTLRRMFSGSVPAKNMMGPWGIARAGAGFASRGMDYLIWFLAMISANLAVVNFLPIPIVDGGLFLFLIIEKFQGRPLSPRVQSIVQLIGIALIVSVFIFVTIQDIRR